MVLLLRLFLEEEIREIPRLEPSPFAEMVLDVKELLEEVSSSIPWLAMLSIPLAEMVLDVKELLEDEKRKIPKLVKKVPLVVMVLEVRRRLEDAKR